MKFAAYCKTQYCVGVGNRLGSTNSAELWRLNKRMKLLCQLIPISPPGWQFLMQELSPFRLRQMRENLQHKSGTN